MVVTADPKVADEMGLDLEVAGFTVTTVPSLAEARAALLIDAPTLVVLDQALVPSTQDGPASPPSDGVSAGLCEAAAALRAERPQAAFVAYTRDTSFRDSASRDSSAEDAVKTPPAPILAAWTSGHSPEERQATARHLHAALLEPADVRSSLLGVDAHHTRLAFPSHPNLVPKVVGFLGRDLRVHLGSRGDTPGPTDLTDVKLALFEALANALEHGNLGISFDEKGSAMQASKGVRALIAERLKDPALAERRVFVEATYATDYVEYCIRDEGVGFDPAARLAGPMADTSALHGRGLKLMEHYMDGLTWNASGNEIRMRKRLP